MTQEEILGQLLAIGSSVFAFIEFLKPFIKVYFAPIDGLSDDAKALIYRLLNVLFCTAIVLSSGNSLNLFQANEFLGQQFKYLGLFLTGLATGLGATVLNFLSNWATLRFITIPKLEALRVKAETLRIAESVQNSITFVSEIKAEKP